MASSPRNAVDSLRNHVAELMSRHTALVERCARLEALLQEREQSIATLQRELEEIHAKYRSLAIAQAVTTQEADVAAARSRFDKLVREIDKCISLLNE